MDSKNLQKHLKLDRRGLLPGFETGRYEPSRSYDPAEFPKALFEDPVRRDNRVNIRVSGTDMAELHQLALAEGVPVQSLLARIVHDYVSSQIFKNGNVGIPSEPAHAENRGSSAFPD